MCCISFSWVSENWILCTLSQNHNIHWGKWCLSAIDNVCIEVKKFVGKEMHFPVIWRSIFQNCPLGALITQQTVKKLNLLGKTEVEKSAWIKAYSLKEVISKDLRLYVEIGMSSNHCKFCLTGFLIFIALQNLIGWGFMEGCFTFQ